VQPLLQPPEHVPEQLEHPLDSEVPVHEVMHPEEHSAVQSVQSSFVQLVNIIGKTFDMAKSPSTGKVFFAAFLKNSLLFCKSLFCMIVRNSFSKICLLQLSIRMNTMWRICLYILF